MNLQFHIELDRDDALASYLAESAQTNDLLNLEGPTGSFVLNENSPRALVFVAEGIGFASVKGLIEHAMALDAAEEIFLFWIASAGQPPYLHNLCRAWNDALDNFTYCPLPATAAEALGEHLRAGLQSRDPGSFDYYLSVSAALRPQCEQFAASVDVPAAQIRFEAVPMKGGRP